MTEFKCKAEHLEKGYVCPACGEDAVEGGEVDINGTEATQQVFCTACEAEWVDVYVLNSVRKVMDD